MGAGRGQALRAASARLARCAQLAGAPALGACLALAAFVPVASAERGACEPWPGEPSPLPTVASRDSASSRWAELRVAELVARAQLAEDTDALESHRLWRRVLCLDPVNQLAWRGLDRTRTLRVYRPVLEWSDGPPGPRRTADPWDDLAAPVQVARARPRGPRPRARPPPRAEPTPPAPPPDPQARLRAAAASRAAVLVAEGESSLRQARFEEALGRAIAARDALAPIDRHPEVEPLRAAAEVLAATAQVALGDDAGAQESFARALAAEPSLRLDPMTTSPKVLRVLDAARASAKGGS